MDTVRIGVFSGEVNITKIVLAYYESPEEHQQLLRDYPVESWEMKDTT
jgi:hypothetical protein